VSLADANFADSLVDLSTSVHLGAFPKAVGPPAPQGLRCPKAPYAPSGSASLHRLPLQRPTCRACVSITRDNARNPA